MSGGPFDEPPYPQMHQNDFGPGKRCEIDVRHGGRTIMIGDPTDFGFQKTHTLISPGPDAVDIVIHGLPGRFVEKLGGNQEIPASLIAQLLASAGVIRGMPLRLLTCHAGELPLRGTSAAQILAEEWGGLVLGANGLLRIRKGGISIDVVEWVLDPSGGMMPNVIGVDQGTWISHTP